MSGYNGSGQFSFTYSWANDAANNVPITASRMDTQFSDAVGGFDLAMTRDGQGAATAIIPFSAGITIGASGDTLSTYDEGLVVFTDASGAGLTFTSVVGFYTRIGRQVTISGSLTYPATADGTASKIGGLPFTVLNTSASLGTAIGYTNATVTRCLSNTTTFSIVEGNGTTHSNAGYSGTGFSFTFTYFV